MELTVFRRVYTPRQLYFTEAYTQMAVEIPRPITTPWWTPEDHKILEKVLSYFDTTYVDSLSLVTYFEDEAPSENGEVSGSGSAIAGGSGNSISGNNSVILGGSDNTAGSSGAILGGTRNTASLGVVLGGTDNTASKSYSVVAGNSAFDYGRGYHYGVGGDYVGQSIWIKDVQFEQTTGTSTAPAFTLWNLNPIGQTSVFFGKGLITVRVPGTLTSVASWEVDFVGHYDAAQSLGNRMALTNSNITNIYKAAALSTIDDPIVDTSLSTLVITSEGLAATTLDWTISVDIHFNRENPE